MSIFADTILFVTNFSSDLILTAIVFAIFACAIFYFGVAFGVNFVISWFIGLTIFRNIPVEKFSTLVKLGIFAVIILGVYFVMRKLLLVHETYVTHRKILRIVLLSFSATILVLVSLIYITPISDLYTFSPSILKMFAPSYLIWWLIAPILALYLAYRT